MSSSSTDSRKQTDLRLMQTGLRLLAQATAATTVHLVVVRPESGGPSSNNDDDITVVHCHPVDAPPPGTEARQRCRLTAERGEPTVSPPDRFNPERPSVMAAPVVGLEPPGSPDTQRVLLVSGAQDRAWSAADITALTDAVELLQATATALEERSGLQAELRSERRRRQLERRVAGLVAATNRQLGTHATAGALAEHGSPVIGASMISLAVVEGDEVLFFHGPGVDDDIASEWTSAPLETEVPMVQAAATGETVVVADLSGFQQWPAMQPYVAQLGLEAFAAVPITDDELGLRACVGMGFTHPLTDGQLPAEADRLLRLASQTLTRAIRFDTRSDQADTLRQVAIPTELPKPDALDIAATYLAPNRYRPVGGDIFDVVAIPDGRTGIIVADATGHDLVATRAATRARYALGILTQLGWDPAATMGAVNDYLCSTGDANRYVTCALAVIDRDRRGGLLATAGHPLPRILRLTGVRTLGSHGDPLLGLHDHTYRQHRFDLEHGDVLLMFTDGMLDAMGPERDPDDRLADAGLQRLCVAPDGWPPPAETVLASLMETMDDDRDDDVAVVVTATGAINPGGDTLRLAWRAGTVSLRGTRQRVSSWLADTTHPPTADEVEDLVLVATELLSNADQAAPEGTVVDLQAQRTEDHVEITVANEGAPITVDGSMPDRDQHRGRGLAIVQQVADRLETTHHSGRTRVTASIATR